MSVLSILNCQPIRKKNWYATQAQKLRGTYCTSSDVGVGFGGALRGEDNGEGSCRRLCLRFSISGRAARELRGRGDSGRAGARSAGGKVLEAGQRAFFR